MSKTEILEIGTLLF